MKVKDYDFPVFDVCVTCSMVNYFIVNFRKPDFIKPFLFNLDNYLTGNNKSSIYQDFDIKVKNNNSFYLDINPCYTVDHILTIIKDYCNDNKLALKVE